MSDIDTNLAGKTVVITRAPEQAVALSEELQRRGAEVLALPTISFAAAENPADLDAALTNFRSFDWLVFTSQNAVRFVCERMIQQGISGDQISAARFSVAAVGLATAGAAGEVGFRVTYIAKNPSGEALASELTTKVAGKRVLLPRSDRAESRLPSALRAAGADVTDVIAYRTLTPAEINPAALARVKSAQVDVVVFASPSSFHNLCDAIPVDELRRISATVNFTAIGPTTAKAMREAGVRVAIQPQHASPISLADAISKYYAAPAAAASGDAPRSATEVKSP